MNRMFRWAMIAMERSKDGLNKIQKDSTYLDFACFDAQRALEFFIKGILLEHSKEKLNTHNIAELFQNLKSTGVTFEREDDLESLADTITAWGTTDLYKSDTHATVQLVQAVHDIFFSLRKAYLWGKE